MLQYFNQTIQPLNEQLAKSLGIKRITVKGFSWEEPVTVQVLEDGLVSDCNHAGATATVLEMEYREAGEYLPYNQQAMACDKCNAWSVDGEEWI